MKNWQKQILKKTENEPIPQVFKTSKDMTKENDNTVDLDFLNNYLSRSSSVLNEVCKNLSKEWSSFNVENIFFLETKAIFFEKKFRIKVLIQSLYNGKNVIFYTRQEIVSGELKNHPDIMKELVKEFISKVMVDLIMKGIESLRRQAINDTRERMDFKKDSVELEDYLLQYPLKADDVYPDK